MQKNTTVPQPQVVDNEPAIEAVVENPTIATIVVDSPDVSILRDIVVQLGLVDTLTSD